jgi:hypothetical protein
MTKDELFRRLDTANHDLEVLFGTLSDEQINRPVEHGDFSAKDLLAHIAAWPQVEANWLRDSLRGRGTVRYAPGFEISLDSPEDEVEEVRNRFNAYVLAQNQDRTIAEIRQGYRRTYRELIEIIEEMSEADLNDPERFDWWRGEPVWSSIAGNRYAHIEEHMRQFQVWLSDSPIEE